MRYSPISEHVRAVGPEKAFETPLELYFRAFTKNSELTDDEVCSFLLCYSTFYFIFIFILLADRP
jgi:hypothetical protein